MRVMVTGSRAWLDKERIQAALVTVNAMYRPPGEPVTLVHGGASGADIIAADVAQEIGWELEEHIPDWSKYGKYAGPHRNVKMLESEVDVVLAFWDGESRGTKHAIETARKMRIPVLVHKPDGTVA